MFRLTHLLAALAAAAPLAARADDPRGTGIEAPARKDAIPDTAAGRQFARWLEAFNSGDREVIGRFNAEHLAQSTREKNPPEQRADRDLGAAEFTGGLVVQSVRSTSDQEMEADAETKLSGERVRVRFVVEAAEPHGLLHFGMRPLPTPASAGGRPTDAEIAANLEALLDRLVAADAFSGAVIVTHGDRRVFARAYGMADKGAKAPNRLDTRFSLASMGKMFTGVAVAQLAGRGKLSFDDKVGKHLPDYPNQDVAAKVTIHQLLTHTSGLGDFFNDRWKATRTELRTVDDYLALFAADPLKFEPGTRWEYSNAGFVVLGKVIEKVTGQDYYEYVAGHVFKPAGMRDAGFFSPADGLVNMATGYTHTGPDDQPRPGPWRSNAGHKPGRGNPAGGAWSSAEDLVRFVKALQDGTLLDAKTAALATGPRAETGQGPDARYGYGFMVHTIQGKRAFGHYGGFPGVSTALEVYPDSGYTVVILSNYDMGSQRVIGRLHEWVARD